MVEGEEVEGLTEVGAVVERGQMRSWRTGWGWNWKRTTMRKRWWRKQRVVCGACGMRKSPRRSSHC